MARFRASKCLRTASRSLGRRDNNPDWMAIVASDMEARPPRLSGVLETSLYVADLDRARAFYQRIFGLEGFSQDGRMCALGAARGQVLLLFRPGAPEAPAPVPGGFIQPH